MARHYENPETHSRTEEHIRIAEFSELLENNLPVSSFEPALPFSADDIVHEASKSARYNTRKNSLAVDSSLLDAITDNEALVTTAFQPRRARSGKKSMHGVFFGDIELSNGALIGVAVKPHEIEDTTRSALTDLLSSYAAQKHGFYTLQPLGIILPEQQESPAYSLTILDESLSTFDSVDWSNYVLNMSENPGMQELWRSVAGQVAVLHDSGQASHGDLAARNIAISGETGAFLIDWEKARFSGKAPRDAEVRYQHSYTDLSMLFESMANPPSDSLKPGIGLFGEPNHDWWPIFREVFFDDYVIAREILATESGSHNKTKRNDVQEELAALSSSLQQDAEMFRKINEAKSYTTA